MTMVGYFAKRFLIADSVFGSDTWVTPTPRVAHCIKIHQHRFRHGGADQVLYSMGTGKQGAMLLLERALMRTLEERSKADEPQWNSAPLEEVIIAAAEEALRQAPLDVETELIITNRSLLAAGRHILASKGGVAPLHGGDAHAIGAGGDVAEAAYYGLEVGLNAEGALVVGGEIIGKAISRALRSIPNAGGELLILEPLDEDAGSGQFLRTREMVITPTE